MAKNGTPSCSEDVPGVSQARNRLPDEAGADVGAPVEFNVAAKGLLCIHERIEVIGDFEVSTEGKFSPVLVEFFMEREGRLPVRHGGDAVDVAAEVSQCRGLNPDRTTVVGAN